MNKTAIGLSILIVLVGIFIVVNLSKPQDSSQLPNTQPSSISDGNTENSPDVPDNSDTEETPAPSTSSESAPAESVREITIEAFEFGYRPSSLAVAPGEKVKIILNNVGKMPHDLRIEELNIGTKVIQGGETDTLEFTAPEAGTYTFYCSVGSHRQLGMQGTMKSE